MNIQFEEINCDSCGGYKFKPLLKVKDALTNYEGYFDLVQCKNCDLVFINPRPVEKDLVYFYPKEFLSYQMEVLKEMQFDLKRRLVNFVSWRVAKQRVDIINRFMLVDEKNIALDFGCGAGEFLNQMQIANHCEVMGVDFNSKLAEKCKAKRINFQEVEVFEKQNVEYDIITIWHVLEHMSSPSKLLKVINSKLKDNGLLFIEVPNWESIENTIFKQKSYLLDSPRHLFQFSPTTLTQMLNREGFEIQHLGYATGEGGWMGSIQNYFFQGKLLKEFYKNIYGVIFISLLSMPLDLISNLIGRGSILKIVAKKRIQK